MLFRSTDNLCATYCNPSPSDGSAPNLVQFARDKHGVLQMQRAFINNTQVNIVFLIYFLTINLI